jgi:nitrogen fixation/metabolism regulation signal transduction histidine kinase
VAAFTPVEENGWIVAVALPESEFSQRVDIIGKQMLLIVILAASITVGVGILFSWQFVKPIKQLAQATNIISAGRLPSQLESTSKDELGILTRSFNHMVRNLRRVQAELVQSEKLGSLGRLATGVAHEIRNPLNDIKIAAEVLLRKNPTAKEAKDLVKLIADEIAHLNSFVTEFLSYAHQPPLKRIASDANQLVTDVLESAKQKMKHNHIELVMDLDTALPDVAIDPFQMERALHNIITNAVEAMTDGGTLRVSTTLKKRDKEHFNPQLMIEIVDSGHGLTTEQLNQTFDPFFTTKDHGTGLGLSLTKSIIEAHDGSITISHNTGPGLSVAIYLPLEISGVDET